MKTKYIILIVFIILISAGTWLYFLYRQLQQLKARIVKVDLAENNPLKDLKIENIADAAKFLADIKNIDLYVTVQVSNFSKKPLTINQAYIEIFDQEQSLRLAEIIEPIQATTIQADGKADIKIKVQAKTLNLLQSLFGATNPIETLENITRLVSGFGVLGKNIKVKGFVRLKNNWINKRFEKTISI